MFEQLSGLMTGIGGIFIGLFIMIFTAGTVLGIGLLIKLIKRYNVKVIIWAVDGLGKTYRMETKGGVFNKGGKRKFWIKHIKRGYDPDKVPLIIMPTGKKEVYMRKDGENYVFLEPNYAENKLGWKVSIEDVNWAGEEYLKIKNVLDWSKIMQYMPYIMAIITILILIVPVIFLFNKFSILKDTADVLKQTADANVKVAESNERFAAMLAESLGKMPVSEVQTDTNSGVG